MFMILPTNEARKQGLGWEDGQNDSALGSSECPGIPQRIFLWQLPPPTSCCAGI
jgi:hypothetical protein